MTVSNESCDIIAVVESLEKSRQPQPTREAVYIIWPNEEVWVQM